MTFSMGGPVSDIYRGGLVSPFNITVKDNLLGEKLTRMCVEYGRASQAWFAQIDENKQINWLSSFPIDEKPVRLDADVQEKALHDGQNTILMGEVSGQTGIFPIQHHHKVIGLLVLRSADADFFTPSTLGWIEAFAETISSNLVHRREIAYRKQTENLVQRVLESGSSLKDDLPSILKALSEMVWADAALMYRRTQIDLKRYDLFASHGPVSPMAKSLPLLSDVKSTPIRNFESVQYKNLVDEPAEKRLDILFHEGYQTYISYPLIAEGEVLGILEMFWRTPQEDKNVSPIIEEIGRTLSWGFFRMKLMDSLGQLNKELLTVHAATLEGLSRALELRDLETEGHTQRVCELTLQLAKHMQIPEEQHVYLFQGALLHDIGKLGIPDAILLKPGSLTPKEWKVMEQHPQYAYNILVPIVSFYQTLDIPLYHHERWNGTGYPFGLKGENIPLFARLFAVVDVFDALTSDRPYRSAWSRTQAKTYIHENGGILFDPQVVDKFLELMEKNKF